MAKTPLGWQVENAGSKNVVTIEVAGRYFPVKRGSGGWIAMIMKALITFLNSIEPIKEAGSDGTYNKRQVTNGTSWSEHAAAIAYDHNASQHPYGAGAYSGWNSHQVHEIEQWLKGPIGRNFRWGGHYTHNKDSMHFELVLSKWMRYRTANIRALKAAGYKP